MPVDYLKLYYSLRADVSLVKVRPSVLPYVERLFEWEGSNVFPHAVTISPKSSPILMSHSLPKQYQILINFLKQTLPQYSNKYFFSFETYSDLTNLHAHGFVNFRTLTDITHFKKQCKSFFYIKVKPKARDKLTDVKLLGNDEDARRRWIAYCYKEMDWSIRNDIPPIYRWDDDYVQPIVILKPEKKKRIECTLIQSQFKLYDVKPPRKVEIIEEYIESESEDENNEDDSEYLLYLRLKSKYENKIKNI